MQLFCYAAFGNTLFYSVTCSYFALHNYMQLTPKTYCWFNFK